MCEITDPELVVRFTENGDIASFNELIGRHIGRIRAIIYGIVLKNADADDLTQEVFLKVMDNAPRFKHKARFSTWLYRIALNTTTDFLRRRGRRPIDYPGDLSPEADRAASPADALMAEEVGGLVDDAMAELTPDLRTAVVLTLIQGFSAGEAARIAGCLPATMYWRVHQAKKILHKRLAGYQG